MTAIARNVKDIKEMPIGENLPSLHDENRLLKSSLSYLKAELNKFKELPMLVCDVKKVINRKAVIKVPNGSRFYVNISGDINISAGDSVLVEQRSLTIIDKLDQSRNFDVEDFLIVEKPNVSWDLLGGLEEQIREIREVVELPLAKPELFKKVGIEPPKGILLYGPPGTGKTLLAKAVATSSNCNFIEVVASELVQKFIGEGAKLVKELFNLARDKSPTIVFIDEIDALASERLDVGTSGEREAHRTFMQLLTEIDGFDNLDNVKIIAATNRIDILDSAILRPGRFDRLIEIPVPAVEGRNQILKIHSGRMTFKDIDFKSVAEKTEGFTGAQLKAVCTEAGYFAIRGDREYVTFEDFEKAILKVNQAFDEDTGYESMFG